MKGPDMNKTGFLKFTLEKAGIYTFWRSELESPEGYMIAAGLEEEGFLFVTYNQTQFFVSEDLLEYDEVPVLGAEDILTLQARLFMAGILTTIEPAGISDWYPPLARTEIGPVLYFTGGGK